MFFPCNCNFRWCIAIESRNCWFAVSTNCQHWKASYCTRCSRVHWGCVRAHGASSLWVHRQRHSRWLHSNAQALPLLVRVLLVPHRRLLHRKRLLNFEVDITCYMFFSITIFRLPPLWGVSFSDSPGGGGVNPPDGLQGNPPPVPMYDVTGKKTMFNLALFNLKSGNQWSVHFYIHIKNKII